MGSSVILYSERSAAEIVPSRKSLRSTLMKDQVDGLRTNGYPAASLHSGIGNLRTRGGAVSGNSTASAGFASPDIARRFQIHQLLIQNSG